MPVKRSQRPATEKRPGIPGMPYARVAMMATLAAAMAMVVTATMWTTAGAQSTTPVASATPTTTPSPSLAKPTEVRYNDRVISWRDNATEEDGYRVHVEFGGNVRDFELPPDTTRFVLPDDFQPYTCPSVSVTVVAFKGDLASEPDSFGIGAICPPELPATPVPAVLPRTGAGSHEAPATNPVLASFAAAGIGTALLLSWAMLRRTRG